MLSLVAYQSSDESESEAEETESGNVVPKNGSEAEETATTSASLNKLDGGKDSSEFKSNNSALSFAIPSKAKETVKIIVPSLKEFEDDDKDEPSVKKVRKSTGCGLISMLPPPKYSKPASSQKPFMPYVLTKKHNPSGTTAESSVRNSSAVVPPKKTVSCIKPSFLTEPDSEKDVSVTAKEENSSAMDFFSLNEPVRHKTESNFSVSLSKPVLKSHEATSAVTGNFLPASSVSQTSFSSPETFSSSSLLVQSENLVLPHSESTSSKNYVAEPAWEDQLASSSYVECPRPVPSATEYAADEGFLRIQGKRKAQEEINIIDISVDDQLSDKTQWLTKSITEEKVHRPSRKKNDMPTQLQKRKHQITYLAFQAKERELELKNQWSQNKLTKRETQAKYGF